MTYFEQVKNDPLHYQQNLSAKDRQLNILAELVDTRDKEIAELKESSLNGWVSVKDRLPTEEDWNLSNRVLVIDYSMNINLDLYDYAGKQWVNRLHVTHWMPLPEPPIVKP